MFFNNLLKSGWLHALFIAVIAYPLASMTQKFVASYTSSNILVYTALFMLSSSVALLFFAGPGSLANSTLRRIETWIYAFLQIGSFILFLLSLQYVSATQGAALGMMSGIFTLVMSVLFLRQTITRYEILGGIVIFIGFYSIIYQTDIPIEAKAMLSIIVISRALLQGSQKIITEIHKTNRKAESFKSQLRVTGFIMAVASFVFLVFLLIIAIIKQNNEISLFSSFPLLSDFVDFNAFVFALFLGMLIVSASKYCEFYAGKTIGAKYLTSITSLQIIFVYMLEKLLYSYGLISEPIIDGKIALALACIIIGNFMISMAGFIKDLSFIKKGQKQDTLANLDDNLTNSLIYKDENPQEIDTSK